MQQQIGYSLSYLIIVSDSTNWMLEEIDLLDKKKSIDFLAGHYLRQAAGMLGNNRLSQAHSRVFLGANSCNRKSQCIK